MRVRRPGRKRNGATLIEAAIVLFTFLVLIMGTMDLAMYQLRANIISEAARQGARMAIIHGNVSPRPAGDASWGPTQVGPVSATDNSAPVQAIKPFLYGLDPSSVTVTFTWLDGSNDPYFQNRVKVTLDASYAPMMAFVLRGSIPIHSTAVMPIAH